MHLKSKIIILLSSLYLLSCNSANQNATDKKSSTKDTALGVIELYDKNASSIIDTNAKIEIIGKGYNWSEGPVWIESMQTLLFSDIPENKIFQWKQDDTPTLYLTPLVYADIMKHVSKDGSNGLALDREGKLIICLSSKRQVIRMNAPLNARKADYTVLAANYNGKKFNSPNDLVADRRNNIYFTDPVYGLPQGENDSTRELNLEGVFKISADGKISLLIDSIPRPNGVALSPDENTLYIASSDDNKPRWYAYNLDENRNIKNGGILLDALPLVQKALVKQKPDGLKTDKYGNIFSAGPDGINIISPHGKSLGLIKIYNRFTSNCAFNKTKDILFITADDVILKVVLHPSY